MFKKDLLYLNSKIWDEQKNVSRKNVTRKKQTKPHSYDRVILRHYPKTIFFYPVGILSIILGIIQVLLADPSFDGVFATLWISLFAFNFIIVSFDFSIGKTAALVVTLMLLFLLSVVLWPEDLKIQLPIQEAVVNEWFYIYVGLIILFILLLSILVSFFEYWEIRPTEIYRHGGLFEDSQRFGNAQDSHIYKETPDIFERLLFRSGTIVIIPEGTKNIYRLENVYNASGKEKKIREILSYVPDKPNF
jgi:hypothetical protein